MASVFPSVEEAARLAVGPGSVTWQRAGDARAMFGAGAALVLQVAHPTVGAGVREHSDFQRDPWGRLLRTLDYTNLLVYGGPERAIATGQRMRAMHQQIKGVAPDGTRYHALEPEAYAWVHATLALMIVAAHERFGRPFTRAQRETFYAEWCGLGRLLGVRERDLPTSGWDAFLAYVDEVIATRLEDNDVVRDVLATLEAPAAPPVPVLRGQRAWNVARLPASRVMWLATVDLLPVAMRAKASLRLTRTQQLELRAVAAASRASTPLMPPVLRTMGPTYLRWRDREIRRGRFGGEGAPSPAVAV